MLFDKNPSRRSVLKAGVASLVTVPLSVNSLFASKKAAGEVRVVFLVGDYWHNGIAQEHHWRSVLEPTGWRLLFAQATEFVTPQLLSDADLFVVARYAGAEFFGWAPDRIVEERPAAVAFMSDEQENAIIENVNRGMGLIASHCSIWNPERKRFLSLLGVEKPIMHTKVQPAHIHNLNQNHPITKGIESFDTGDDEIFNAVLVPGQSELLFNTKGEEQVIDAFGGWCREEGKGRIVALLPGHTQPPFQQKEFKEIMWRSAYWAMNKKIPASNIKEGY